MLDVFFVAGRNNFVPTSGKIVETANCLQIDKMNQTISTSKKRSCAKFQLLRPQKSVLSVGSVLSFHSFECPTFHQFYPTFLPN